MDYIATFIEKYIDFTYALMRYALMLWLTANIFEARHWQGVAILSAILVLIATPAFMKEGKRK